MLCTDYHVLHAVCYVCTPQSSNSSVRDGESRVWTVLGGIISLPIAHFPHLRLLENPGIRKSQIVHHPGRPLVFGQKSQWLTPSLFQPLCPALFLTAVISRTREVNPDDMFLETRAGTGFLHLQMSNHQTDQEATVLLVLLPAKLVGTLGCLSWLPASHGLHVKKKSWHRWRLVSTR